MESEYYEPKLLKGEKEKPSIIVDAHSLRRNLKKAKLMMTNVDRREYGDEALFEIRKVIMYFHMAYDFEEERLFYLKEMWAWIAAFKDTMRTIGEDNVIHIQPKHIKMTPDQMKLELFNALARLDEGAYKWKNSVTRLRKRQ